MKSFRTGFCAFFLLCIYGNVLQAQQVSYGQKAAAQYLESIRDNEARLTDFFAAMPKGGDLHHHFLGAVYAETFVRAAVANDMYVNTQTLHVSSEKQQGSNWTRFSSLAANGKLDHYKQRLIRKWSVKDFDGVGESSHHHFFAAFGAFAPAALLCVDEGLIELQKRAIEENVSYIETMFLDIPCGVDVSGLHAYNDSLEHARGNHDEVTVLRLLSKLDKLLTPSERSACVKAFNKNEIKARHEKLHLDNDKVIFRYQNGTIRTIPPVSVFKNLLVAFESADKSPLIVGVNIFAPEDDEVALRDYWLHMMMYKYCHEKYPQVTYAMHAGELALGLVEPEDMTWHIKDAVKVAGTRRVGHGTDIAREDNNQQLLQYMSRSGVAVELSLFSNEFILGVKDDASPISLYRDNHVPIVICTDDAGVLRTDLTQQYVLLAKRYSNISYTEIKQYVYNSIGYSFIEEKSVKDDLLRDLDKRFERFESSVAKAMRD